MKVYHDTGALDLMEKVNKLLKKHGLWFEDISEDGKDYLEYSLKIEEPVKPAKCACIECSYLENAK